MLKSPFKTAAFKALEREWNEKLKDDGFRDIEKLSNEAYRLPEKLPKAWHNCRFQKIPKLKIRSTQEYYSRARDLLWTYEFKNETQKKIWELHCEGMSKREIAKEIKDFPKSYGREQVGNILRKIRESIE